MRAIFGAGVTVALECMGFSDCFDYVVGISSGSVDCAYFLGGQAETGQQLFIDNAEGGRFINLTRPWKVVDIDYLEYLLRTGSPLDVDAILRRHTEFWLAATDAATGTGQFIDAKNPKVDLITAVKASCAIPVLYNRTVTIGDTRYGDGGVGCGLPIRELIEERGCTDVLVVLSGPHIEEQQAPPVREHVATWASCRGAFSAQYRQAMRKRNLRYIQTMKYIHERGERSQEVNIVVLAPRIRGVSQICKNRATLRALAEQGRQEAEQLFEGET